MDKRLTDIACAFKPMIGLDATPLVGNTVQTVVDVTPCRTLFSKARQVDRISVGAARATDAVLRGFVRQAR